MSSGDFTARPLTRAARRQIPSFVERNALRFELEPSAERGAAALFQMSNLVRIMTAPLDASRDIIIGGVRRRFRTETSPDGIPWQAWSDSYQAKVAYLEANGLHTGRKLQKSEYMMQVATSPYAYIVGYDTVFFDWDIAPIYAAVQNFGGFVGIGNASFIPARPFMGIDDMDQETITLAFISWLNYILGSGVKTFQGAGGRFASWTKTYTGI